MHFKFTKLLFECKTKIHHARCPGFDLNTCPVLEVLLGCIVLLALNSRIEVLNEDSGSLLKGFPKNEFTCSIYIYYIYNMFKDGFSWGENMVG